MEFFFNKAASHWPAILQKWTHFTENNFREIFGNSSELFFTKTHPSEFSGLGLLNTEKASFFNKPCVP